MSTKIEWTNETWNPIIGCSKISTGCENCYAEKMAYRLANIKATGYYEKVLAWNKALFGKWNGRTILVESALEKPFKWKNPRKIFVCSMGDLFHESVPFERIDKVWFVIAQNPQHTFQVLTKRPERMKDYFIHMGREAQQNDEECIAGKCLNPLEYFDVLPNLWLGVTAENQEQANKRIPILLEIPAAKRFVSCEPLLSDIEITSSLAKDMTLKGHNIDWVICGPETGSKARPMQKEWIENIYAQCKSASVPFFDKKNTLGLNLTEIPK